MAVHRIPPLQPGNTIEVEYQWHNSDDRWLTYHPITVWGEADTDMLYASGQSGLMELYGSNNQGNFDQMAPTRNSSATLNTNGFEYDLSWGELVNLVYRDSSGNYQYDFNHFG